MAPRYMLYSFMMLHVSLLVAQGTCPSVKVRSDVIGQVKDLIEKYDKATIVCDKECYQKNMHELLKQLQDQNLIFGGAMNDEARSGELEASIVNEQEQVEISKAITLLQDKLKMIASQKPSAKRTVDNQLSKTASSQPKRK